MTPQSIEETDLPVNVIYSFDLGMLVPAFALSAYWLRQRRSWGYAFTAVLLVKIATLGGAALAMSFLAMSSFMIRQGHPVTSPQTAIFGTLTLLALGLMVRFVRSVGSRDGGTSKARN